MIDAKGLLADLQKLLTQLEDDIRRRCEGQAEVDAPLRDQHAAAKSANRTAQAYEVWRDEQITQAAVAWILGCVFVRFCEDNLLIDPPRLSGPGERRKRAEDEHTLYFQRHPTHSDREYLLWVFQQVSQLPSMKELFDERHNPLWALGLSGDGAMLLRNFWLKRDATTGLLVHDFTHPAFVPGIEVPAGLEAEAQKEPTRFLGDLYQDLSESARKKYALLQTPVFVEEFILDRTLTPAIAEFGFQQVRLIDPTCGSGHFLLGAFQRLFELWVKHEPTANVRELARRALSQVYGVDLNPYAVAIARFRLVVAALRACDVRRLDAADFASHVNVATGDSLLHGVVFSQDVLGFHPMAHFYRAEDELKLRKYLGQQYHAVVGNPPYITPKDKALNEAYRENFKACHRKYSLCVPFFQRFFNLALDANAGGAGFVGQITANSFMKREFGKKLVEEFLPRWDLTHVIDAQCVHIPEHGTSTAILFGRNRPPASAAVRVVNTLKNEEPKPVIPEEGKVWLAVVAQIALPDSRSEFVEVADIPRASLHRHPWSIGGGGASALKELLEDGCDRLGEQSSSIGFFSIPGDEDVFVATEQRTWSRLRVVRWRPMVTGDGVRDWLNTASEASIYPYTEEGSFSSDPGCDTHFWKYRSILRRSLYFGRTREERGLDWREFAILLKSKMYSRLAISFTNVATQNHFVLDREMTLFDSHAPIIKLPPRTDEDTHLQLVGILNSSAACFWMKQVFFDKGGGGIGGGISAEPWERRYEIDGTKLKQFPLPEVRSTILTMEIDRDAIAYAAKLPDSMCRAAIPRAQALAAAREAARLLRGRMIALQEELDWQCYRLYGLLPANRAGDYESPGQHDSVLPIELGQRAFEIVLARQMAAGEVETTWFERHGSTPITEIPEHWPEAYKQVVRRRIEIIERDKNIALIERPEYKRRWNAEPWEQMQERALRYWLLDRLEGWPIEKGDAETGRRADAETNATPRSLIWNEQEPRVMSVAQLADRVRQDTDFMQVAALYRGREDFDVTKLVAELVEDEAVPFLPVLRYKESGLRNRRVWEQVWDLQRQEDAIEARTTLPPTDPRYLTEQQATAEKKAKVGDIPVPPKYKSADMLNGTIWRLRGKLDVPKERFISFPHCQRDSDPTLVVTWAGYDHLQQMQALAAYYMEMKEKEGWPPERRVPLLAGMLELLPWVLQWYNDVHPDFGVGMGNYYRDFINDEAREMGKTAEQMKAWTPPKKAAGRGRKGAG